MQRYYSYTSYLKKTYGRRVYRVGVDAGFSCPHRDSRDSGGCIYCDNYGGTAAYQRSGEASLAGGRFIEHIASSRDIETCRFSSIRSQIDSGISFLKKRYHAEEISLYLQAYSNTFAPIPQLKKIYDYALGCYDFREFIVSTRPDCISRETCILLEGYRSRVSDVWVELGLQSANDAALRFLNRGHSVSQVRKACAMLKEHHLQVSLHLILGLPGEGEHELDITAEFIREIHPQAIKIHNLHIPAGTALFDLYRSGEVACTSVHRHIQQSDHLLRQIPGDIIIQRFVCDTPSHRLCAPRNFPKKGKVIQMIADYLEARDSWQGKSLGWTLDTIGECI